MSSGSSYVHRVQLMFPEYSLCLYSTFYVLRVQFFSSKSTVYVRREQVMSSKYSFWLQRTVYVLRAQLMFPEYSLSP